MKVNLRKANLEDCKKIDEIQKLSFAPLIKKYRQAEICIGCESFEDLNQRLAARHHNYYMIEYGCVPVGLIHIEDLEKESFKQLHTVCVLPHYRGKGIAQKALDLLETSYSDSGEVAPVFAIDAIKEERVNLYLTEKLGYSLVNESKVDDQLTKVHFIKPL